MDKELKNNMQANEISDSEIDKVVGGSCIQIKGEDTVTSTVCEDYFCKACRGRGGNHSENCSVVLSGDGVNACKTCWQHLDEPTPGSYGLCCMAGHKVY